MTSRTTARILALGLASALLAGPALLAPPPALAQQANLRLGGDKPIDVVADGGFEFFDEEKVAVARGGAVATQGELTLKAQTLAAYFRKGAGGENEIYRLAAEGGVEIRSATQTAYGDRAVYDVDKGVAVLTGQDLRLVTETDTITAKDSLEFWRQQNLAVARGDAVAVREGDRVRADRLVGLLQENPAGQLEMSRIDAEGGVVITTPTEVARGDRGTYDSGQKVAVLTGNVRITRGQNQLNGTAAEVNLETGVSRLLSRAPGGAQGASPPASPQDGRVRGLFIPERRQPQQPTPGTPSQGAPPPSSPGGKQP